MEKASWKNGLVGVNIYPLFFSCDLSRFPCFSPSLLVYSALIDTVLSIPLCVNGSLLPDGFWPHSAIVVAALPSFLLFLSSFFSHNPPLSPLSPSFSTNLWAAVCSKAKQNLKVMGSGAHFTAAQQGVLCDPTDRRHIQCTLVCRNDYIDIVT